MNKLKFSGRISLIAALIFLSFMIISCQKSQESIKKMKDELMQVDLDFSALSEEKGLNHAFLEYAHEEAVFLRDNAYPLVGKDKIRELFEARGDADLILTWKPLHADVAASGELGYSYGIYELKSGDNVSKGTYTSVWKKNSLGRWRWILDTGNVGLGEEAK